MHECDTHIQMVAPAKATVLQVYNRATDSWLPSFDMCVRVFDGEGRRLDESVCVADLPSQPRMRPQLTIKTADVAMYRKCVERFPSLHDAAENPGAGHMTIWVRICFLDAWKALDQLNAETHRLWRATSQLTERLRVLGADFPADLRYRLERLEVECGLNPEEHW